MRVHPKGAAEAQWKVIVGAAAWRDRRPRNAGDTVLLPWWRQAMPVHQCRHIELVLEAHPKLPPDSSHKTWRPIRLAHRQDRGRLALDLDAAALNLKHGDRISPAGCRLSERLCSRHHGSGEDVQHGV